MTLLRVIGMHMTDFGLSWEDWSSPGRVMVHAHNLRRLEQLLDEMEGRVHRARTSPSLDTDISRWCAEGRAILAAPYYLHESRRESNVIAFQREERHG